MVLETQIMLCVTEPDFFSKISFAPNIGKMGQNWAKNRVFLNFIKKISLSFSLNLYYN